MTNLQRLIFSIRELIPDRTDGDDPHIDGRGYSLATLLKWIDDAGDLMCTEATIIQDWYAIPSVVDQDVYELPENITSIEQAWYNNLPLDRSSEQENLFTAQRSGSAWWFSPHSIHVIPRFYLYPSPSVAAPTTQLDGGLSATATTLTVDSTTDFLDYGFVMVDSELMRYSKIGSSTTLRGVLRGQGGTEVSTHADNATVTNCNIMFKCFRLPVHLTDADSVLEIPRGLIPLLELYVMSRVKASEQDEQGAQGLYQQFMSLVKELADKAPTKGLRQGIQVKTWPDGGTASNVRVYIP